MKIKKFNKKGDLGTQIMFVVFFIVVIIIGVGLVTGVYMFYGKDYEFREVDARSLNYNMQSCLSQQKIDFTKTSEQITKEIFAKCTLNEKVIAENYYFQIYVNDGEKIKFKDINKCALSDKNELYPQCVSSDFFVNNEKFTLITGTDQRIKTLPA